MVRVITYGTFDVLHYGHIRLLERAKSLGDYLIVGVTSDDYDKTRGKINLQQSLMERVDAVRATGLADEIIVEEYEGQKIDDIKKYNIDIFTVGSDWIGYFDYLKEYCKVVYLSRTEGVSSSDIRGEKRFIRLGLLGDADYLKKVLSESKFVDGICINSICTNNPDIIKAAPSGIVTYGTDKYDEFLSGVEAVYIRSRPNYHYDHIMKALQMGKHVLCESPITLVKSQSEELIEVAGNCKLILMEAIKTAYATAYERLLLLLKGGIIGKVVSVDSTCTSIRENRDCIDWENIYEWGPTALLPIFHILGTEYKSCTIVSHLDNEGKDSFTKIDFLYDHSVASIKIGNGVKSEGELIVSGTKGYIYVPAPWWKTDYFEVRYEDQSCNRRYFYQLDGEGIRYELVSFLRDIEQGTSNSRVDTSISLQITAVMEQFINRRNMDQI